MRWILSFYTNVLEILTNLATLAVQTFTRTKMETTYRQQKHGSEAGRLMASVGFGLKTSVTGLGFLGTKHQSGKTSTKFLRRINHTGLDGRLDTHYVPPNHSYQILLEC